MPIKFINREREQGGSRVHRVSRTRTSPFSNHSVPVCVVAVTLSVECTLNSAWMSVYAHAIQWDVCVCVCVCEGEHLVLCVCVSHSDRDAETQRAEFRVQSE